jgi:hypothetical protein
MLGSGRTNQRFAKPAHVDDAQRDEHRKQRELSNHKGGSRSHSPIDNNIILVSFLIYLRTRFKTLSSSL